MNLVTQGWIKHICFKCGHNYQPDMDKVAKIMSTFPGECDWCGSKGTIANVSDFGYPKFPNASWPGGGA